ncbi:MAG: PAS domain-containing sensor histidine kinase [Verrucomicrobiaceae bacterium]|nr:PAS domain-containing sensor histidine kinase [Verrucomicrobiaceae bacterium]
MIRFLLFSVLALTSALVVTVQGQADVLPMTSVEAVKRVQLGEAVAHAFPVRLHGIVVSAGPVPQRLVLHDGKTSIMVIAPVPMPNLRIGQEVDVEGYVSNYELNKKRYHMIAATSVKAGDFQPLPAASPASFAELNACERRDQWVSTQGWVVNWRRSSSRFTIKLASKDGWLTALLSVPEIDQLPENILGAKVRITGINTQENNAGESIQVDSIDRIEMLEPGTNDPFDAPLVSMKDVSARKVILGKRLRVRGTLITVMEQRKLIVQGDGETAAFALAETRVPGDGRTTFGDGGEAPALLPGDQVEIIGSAIDQPSFAMKTYGMVDCYVRVTGKGRVPKPEQVTIDQFMKYRSEGHWVTFEGIVHAWMLQPNAMTYSVGDEETWTTVGVRSPDVTHFPKDLFGARLRFTGLATGLALNFRGAEMIVPDPSFVEVIKTGKTSPFDAPEFSTVDVANGLVPQGEPVRTRGVLVGREPSVLYVRGERAAICVSLQMPWVRPGNPPAIGFADCGLLPELKVGDLVEVSGHRIPSPRYAAYDLASSSVRITGHQEKVSPVDTTVNRITAGEHTSDLVQIRARLLTIQVSPVGRGEWRTTMLLKARGQRLTAVHQSSILHPFDSLKVDDDLLVQGVVDKATPDTPRQLWLFSPLDVKSLGVSAELVERRLGLWVGSSVLVVGLLFAWIMILRRSQRRQAAATAALKEATDAARASEQRWKLLFEQSPLSVQIFAPDGQTKRFNEAWQKLFRLSEEQGYAFNVLNDPDLNASGAVNAIRKAFEGEVVHVPPVPYPVPGDPPETRWIGGVLYPVKNEAGEVIEVVTIHNDITEMKQAEESMQALNQTLEQRVQARTAELEVARANLSKALEQERELNDLKSRFVSMVSHEFRTPLGVTMSAVEIMRHFDDKLPPEKRRELCDEIHGATRNMAGLMEQVLVLGRVEAGKLGFRPAPVDLEVLISKLIDESLSATNRKCPIKLHCEGDLSGARGDEALIRHILSNLIHNAVKYSPEEVDVMVRVGRDGGDVVCEVEDHGIGIPEHDRAHLYEAFHRCTNVGDIPGTGLGLVIVKRCVDLHEGSIELKSEVGKGTTFIIRLPMFDCSRSDSHSQ